MNLQAIDNFTRKMGPVSALIDMVMEIVLPKGTASADCGNCSYLGDVCYRYCDCCAPSCSQWAVYETFGGTTGPGQDCTWCANWGCITTKPDGSCQPGTPC
jgi:hypothetical protein